MDRIEKTIRAFITENFLFGEDDGLNNDTSFVEEGIIDSTGVLELVVFIEKTFPITVEDDELIPENLDSILNVEAYLKGKLSERPKAKVVNLNF